MAVNQSILGGRHLIAPKIPVPPRRPKRITKAEVEYAKKLIETADRDEATKMAIKAGEQHPETLPTRLNIRKLLDALLPQHGLSLEDLVKVHAANLHAEKTLPNGASVPDYRVRQDAVRDGYALHGLDKGSPANQQPVIHITITAEQRLLFEKIRGAPLPETVGITIEADNADNRVPALAGPGA